MRKASRWCRQVLVPGACAVLAVGCGPAVEPTGNTLVPEAITVDTGTARQALQYDLLEFMRNTSGSPTLEGNAGFVSYFEDGNPAQGYRFFYVKNDTSGVQFERYALHGDYIALERDTSWPVADAHGNDAYDALPYGSLKWAKRFWSPGESFRYDTTIVGFNHHSSGTRCRADWEKRFGYPVPSSAPSAQKVFRYFVANKDWGNGLVADSIGIEYNNGAEVHWYARGYGWVAWEGPDGKGGRTMPVWNRRTTTRRTPVRNCDDLATWPAPYLETSTMRSSNQTDWMFCAGKATCADNEAIVGLSQIPNGTARTALCRRADSGAFSGTVNAILELTTSDNRRMTRTVGGNPDWDSGAYKLECGNGEYVSGVAMNAAQCYGNNFFQALRCNRGNGLTNNCRVRAINGGDDRTAVRLWAWDDALPHETWEAYFATGDWDSGAFKMECGFMEYVAGVSVNLNTRVPHALLCCDRSF